MQRQNSEKRSQTLHTKKTYDFLAPNLGEKLKHTKDINQKYELFHKNLVEVTDQNAPLKPLTKKSQKAEKTMDQKK